MMSIEFCPTRAGRHACCCSARLHTRITRVHACDYPRSLDSRLTHTHTHTRTHTHTHTHAHTHTHSVHARHCRSPHRYQVRRAWVAQPHPHTYAHKTHAHHIHTTTPSAHTTPFARTRYGELGWHGFNSGVMSSKRRQPGKASSRVDDTVPCASAGFATKALHAGAYVDVQLSFADSPMMHALPRTSAHALTNAACTQPLTHQLRVAVACTHSLSFFHASTHRCCVLSLRQQIPRPCVRSATDPHLPDVELCV
jgi:hypothetical protein